MSASSHPPHWMLMEGHETGEVARFPHRSRVESVGLKLPSGRLTTDELLASMRHHPNIELERLTGIRSRNVCVEGEDSFTLAAGAARDCLFHSSYDAADLDMLISCSISKNIGGGLTHQLEPPMSLAVKETIGASRATSFDLSNACAGMMTGVFILNDFIRRGAIRRGMVVSGESISNLGTNASKEIHTILSDQVASLTLGDAGAAVIVDRASTDSSCILLAGFTTISEHSRLCVGFPSRVGPGATMHTKARRIHRAAIEEAPTLLAEALEQSGVGLDEIDFIIPHQTSARAIRKGAAEIGEKLGVPLKNVVENIAENGNTASTTHFVALHQYLEQRRFRSSDKILLISFASGLEIGVTLFSVGDLVGRYGNED